MRVTGHIIEDSLPLGPRVTLATMERHRQKAIICLMGLLFFISLRIGYEGKKYGHYFTPSSFIG
jgi:hypothetical protein